MTSIKTSIRIEATGLGSLSVNHTQQTEAYDAIDISVPEDGATVELQPGGAGQVVLFMMTADSYSADLTYSVTGGSEDVPLDAPVLLLGAGAVGLLGSTQNTLTFTNGTGAAVGVHIRIGRDATTTP